MSLLEIEKGYFPYELLNNKTLEYREKIQKKIFFNYRRISTKEKKKLDKDFYLQFDNCEHNIKKECICYCTQNVSIFRRCFKKFR